MTTLALYISFLVSEDRILNRYESHDLSEVLRDYAAIEKFNAFASANSPYVLSADAIAEIKAGRKIAAIKLVRSEHALVDGVTVGLREAKDIVDTYIREHPAPKPIPSFY